MLNEILLDLFDRVKQSVHTVTEGLSASDLVYRPAADANTIAWLVWHLTRIQDDHISALAKAPQAWHSDWSEKFALPLKANETGYGHTNEQVAQVRATSELLTGYFDATHERTVKFINSLKPTDYLQVVDESWQPPVTLSVRLVSIINDDLEHVGQAAYIKGSLLGKV